MIRRLLLLAIGLSTTSLVTFYGLTGGPGGVALSLVIGLAWIMLEWYGKRWAAAPAMFFTFILAAFGAIQERYTLLCLFAGVFALSAWDLSRFLQRLQLLGTPHDASWDQASRRHLQRLLAVNGSSFLLALLAINLRWSGPFFLVFFLALVFFVALFALLMRLARLTD